MKGIQPPNKMRLQFERPSTTVLLKQTIFSTALLLSLLGRKFKILGMWTMFVFVSSLVSTVHFSAMYARAVVLKPVW